MISITKITPPADIKVQQPNIYDAYNHFMQGETAIGRATLAAYYRNGIDNPRATLYEAAIERKNINQIAQLNMMILPDTYKSNLKRNHYAAMKEINFHYLNQSTLYLSDHAQNFVLKLELLFYQPKLPNFFLSPYLLISAYNLFC